MAIPLLMATSVSIVNADMNTPNVVNNKINSGEYKKQLPQDNYQQGDFPTPDNYQTLNSNQS